MRPTRRALAAGIAAATALAALPAASATATVKPDDRWTGSPRAGVTVIEYASLTCPHCGRWHDEVWPAFKAKYVDTGLVRFVFRELPTDPAPVAVAGFQVARCARPADYFKVIDSLFSEQRQLFRDGDVRGWLIRAGAKAGLSESRTLACAQDKKAFAIFTRRVERNTTADDVNSTPTFIIGGTRLVGEQSLDALDAAIQPLLRRKR
jgi:protein-disulfide isomerase